MNNSYKTVKDVKFHDENRSYKYEYIVDDSKRRNV